MAEGRGSDIEHHNTIFAALVNVLQSLTHPLWQSAVIFGLIPQQPASTDERLNTIVKIALAMAFILLSYPVNYL